MITHFIELQDKTLSSVEDTNMEASVNVKINHCPVIDSFTDISQSEFETA